MDDDMWQTDDTHHLEPPPPLESVDHTHSHSDNDDEHHSHTRSHRMTAEEAESYRQQQLEALTTASSSPHSNAQLTHRTEVAVDDDNQSTDDTAPGGAISIELPKDLVTAANHKEKKFDKAAFIAREKKKAMPRFTAEAKATRLRTQEGAPAVIDSTTAALLRGGGQRGATGPAAVTAAASTDAE